jgi:hypothetical protein
LYSDRIQPARFSTIDFGSGLPQTAVFAHGDCCVAFDLADGRGRFAAGPLRARYGGVVVKQGGFR